MAENGKMNSKKKVVINYGNDFGTEGCKEELR